MYPVEDYYWEDACEWLKWAPPVGGKGGKGGKGKKGGGGRGPDLDAIQTAYDYILQDNTAKNRPGVDRVKLYSERYLNSQPLDRIYVSILSALKAIGPPKEA